MKFQNIFLLALCVSISSASSAMADATADNSDLQLGNTAAAHNNYSQAISAWEQAAAAGNAQAMFNLGSLYQNGQGVVQDYHQAVQWYWKAASAGNTDAMTSLGSLCAQGKGVPRDYLIALVWYQNAADQGNPDAMNNVGVIYQNGLGV